MRYAVKFTYLLNIICLFQVRDGLQPLSLFLYPTSYAWFHWSLFSLSCFVGQPFHINEEQLYATKPGLVALSTEQDTAESHYVYLFFLLTILSLLIIILAFISTGQLDVLSNRIFQNSSPNQAWLAINSPSPMEPDLFPHIRV